MQQKPVANAGIAQQSLWIPLCPDSYFGETLGTADVCSHEICWGFRSVYHFSVFISQLNVRIKHQNCHGVDIMLFGLSENILLKVYYEGGLLFGVFPPNL